ncbi:MAG: hypothetical protein VYB40_00345 [Candidatus Thermoplasmatota archaeon]|nr:hypothetical protein [Candidatus Thermoplasmatota archaeon]
MRRIVYLLVLLLVMPALSGCIGGPSVSWGDGDGEYSATMSTVGDDSTGITSPAVSVTNNLAQSTSNRVNDENLLLDGCSNSTFSISGWLVQTKVFDEPETKNHAITSWMIKEMSYGEAQEIDPGSIMVTIVNSEKDWAAPNHAEASPTNANGQPIGEPEEFPHRNWALVAIIPANENIFDAILLMDSNQAVELNGYLVQGKETVNQEEQLNGCDITASQQGWRGHLVVTSITYGNDRVVNGNEEYISGDIPFFGRGLYTTVLLASFVAGGAMFIFSRNQIRMSADTQAQTMLSEQQMRAGKSARHEAARHDARMKATKSSSADEYTGKPKKKSTAVTFDINAALSQDSPGESTGHYVAGSSVTVTEEAESMQEMITEMQEEQAFEQELKDKGLRNLIGTGGAGNIGQNLSRPKRARVTPSAPVEEIQPNLDTEPEEKPKTRRTRKTKSPEPEEEIIEEKPVRRANPDVNDDGDFSDFSF